MTDSFDGKVNYWYENLVEFKPKLSIRDYLKLIKKSKIFKL